MALKDVIIGYAKGDKGDKGDTGERGATGQTGPQGEPGNIADAAITDTQGLDVAKGAKTTAQKLFDAIADRIVNKLVTNDTLTTKLADYLLKSAMSSTNIDSTTNVPTSALVYSLMQDVNNNLSNFTVMRNASGVNQFKAVDQNGNNGMLFKVKDNSEFSVNVWKDNAFGNEKILATKDDLNTVLRYRGVITGDLNRGRNLAIAPGIYSIQSVSTVTNGPSDFIGWGIFVQFPDDLFSQMILNSPNYIKFRKYAGSNPSWSAW